MAKTKSIGTKAASKKASPTKDLLKEKVKQLEKRINQLEATLKDQNEETEAVDYNLKFFGGAGEIQFKGEHLQRTEDNDTTFHVNQTKRKHRVQVGGVAPVGNNGRIEVQVSQNGSVITPFSENVFKKGVFMSQIIYTVK